MVGMMQDLEYWLREHEGSVLCYSGGLDSTALLCNCISYIPKKFEAVFFELPMTTERQKRTALKNASEMGCELHIIRVGEDMLKDMLKNDSDRCYQCKKAIYSLAKEFAEDNGYQYVLSGDNYDDLSEERLGRRPAEEYGVLSPLEILGIGRCEIREFIREKGLDLIKDTCMATRYPQGTVLTEEMFRYAEECESEVRRISGLRQLRVRISGKEMTVQTSEEEMSKMMSFSDRISSILTEMGADKVTLSEEPYRNV